MEPLVCRRLDRTDDAFERAVTILLELRTHLDRETAIARIAEQEQAHGYELHASLRGAQPIAVAGFRVVQTLARGKHLHLDDLVVTSSERGNGTGKALLAHVESEARRRGLAAVFLDARPEAINFYERAGYEPHTAPLYRRRLA
jgi:GNAT superfamily N-acetyltransferase